MYEMKFQSYPYILPECEHMVRMDTHVQLRFKQMLSSLMLFFAPDPVTLRCLLKMCVGRRQSNVQKGTKGQGMGPGCIMPMQTNIINTA